ncbi:MAG TPA: hypothetical protein HPP77_05550 [Candidatus Hydrogenedentes bacterium]|nr:hypothetical protein [Candidatus Hydrogenedentota bacterium]
MPVIPHGDWKRSYLDFVRELLERVPLERLTLGGISMDSRTRLLLERRMGKDNAISRNLSRRHPDKEDKVYYPFVLCEELFRKIAALARRIQPDLNVEMAIP